MNASHSLSYAYDSLYGAYLKSHYPLEYYTVALNLYDGDAERTSKLTNELDYFNIKLKEPKFRYANASYSMDKETNTIYKGIKSIKFLNETVANELYSLRDNEYVDFLDLLVDIDKLQINSRQLEILVRLDFFSEFGKRKYLLDIVNIYNKWFKKKTFKKSNLPLSETKMREISEKETTSQFSKVDNKTLCKILINTLDEDEELDISEIISNECEYYGNPTTINENEDPRLCIALEINTKYTPIIKFYNICSGRTCNVKISKKLWKNNLIEKYNVVYLNNTFQKNKMKKENNQWITLEEYDVWCDDYKIRRDYE